MNPERKRQFPAHVSEAGSPVSLAIFELGRAEALWRHILSDREHPWRKNIWPGMEKLQDLVDYMTDCEDPNSLEVAYFIHNESGEIVGSFHVHQISWANERTEVGYCVHHRFEGKGYASAALKLAEKMLAQMGFRRIEIRCGVDNHRSCALAERNGYQKEGVLRQDTREGDSFRDTVVYAKLLGQKFSL